MITAEEFLTRDSKFAKPLTKEEKIIYLTSIITHQDYVNDMIEFTKFHVTEALKQASEKATTKEVEWGLGVDIQVDKDSILNAYDLNLIK